VSGNYLRDRQPTHAQRAFYTWVRHNTETSSNDTKQLTNEEEQGNVCACRRAPWPTAVCFWNGLLGEEHYVTSLHMVFGRGRVSIYADHIEAAGTALFDKCCELDLEGIIAKDKHAPYNPERPTWFKIRNRKYSQMVGREELFESERHREPVPGWHSCALAAMAGG